MSTRLKKQGEIENLGKLGGQENTSRSLFKLMKWSGSRELQPNAGKRENPDERDENRNGDKQNLPLTYQRGSRGKNTKKEKRSRETSGASSIKKHESAPSEKPAHEEYKDRNLKVAS